MRLVLLGLPGAGKGTQGELLSETLNVPHVSTGAMFRQEIESQTELGKRAQSFMDRGELVPDEVSVEIVKRRLGESDCANGFILDGFPRSVPQAQALDLALPQLGVALESAINIQISESEAVRRISDRLVCRQCGSTYSRKWEEIAQSGACPDCGGPLIQRADDTEETAKNRLRVYLDQTHPVVAYYRSRGILITVNGEQPVMQVYTCIIDSVKPDGVKSPSTGVGQ